MLDAEELYVKQNPDITIVDIWIICKFYLHQLWTYLYGDKNGY